VRSSHLQCAPHAPTLAQQLRDPVRTPEQSRQHADRKRHHQRNTQRRRNVQERELDIRRRRVHRSDQQREQRSNDEGE